MLQYHALKLIERHAETDRAVTLEFAVPAELAENYRFLAGQHLGIKATVLGEELRRTYSICDARPAETLSICVRRVPGGRFSAYLADTLRPGDSVEVLTPNGSFHPGPRPSQGRLAVAFAAGIGITPVIAIVRHVLESEPDSRVLLFYGNREVDSVLFTDELQALKDRFVTRFGLHFLLTAEAQEIELYNGRLDAAKLGELTPGLFDARAVDEYFLCGPGSMIETLTAALVAKGVEPGRIHGEHFLAAAPAATAPRSAVQREEKAASGAEVAHVSVRIDGRTRSFEMPMDGTAVLDAANEAGLDLPFSCRAGVCSTCRTRLVKGKVEMHTNYALEQHELDEGFILACQAHPVTQEIELTYDSR
ncbi:MAG: 2Fe-2S iron-sulfur cluster-binding protein [Steroidobacteraceae bacterium]